jgi:hypothetical protein
VSVILPLLFFVVFLLVESRCMARRRWPALFIPDFDLLLVPTQAAAATSERGSSTHASRANQRCNVSHAGQYASAKNTGEQANFKRSAVMPVDMVLPVAGQRMTTVPIQDLLVVHGVRWPLDVRWL